MLAMASLVLSLSKHARWPAPPCALTCSISSFRPSGSPCARRGRAMRRGCWWCRARAPSRTCGVRDLPALLRAGDVLVFNDTG